MSKIFRIWRMYKKCSKMEFFYYENQKVSIFLEKEKVSSGARFWNDLNDSFLKNRKTFFGIPDVVFLNISCPIYLIFFLRLRKIKTVLRVDGLYSESLSKDYFASLSFFRKVIFYPFFLLNNYISLNFTGHLVNCIDRNLFAFVRIILCDHIIYQSQFSKKMHTPLFSRKNSSVILNGAKPKDLSQTGPLNPEKIHLVHIFADGKRSNKRQRELYDFFEFFLDRNPKTRIDILGLPANANKRMPSDLDELKINKIISMPEVFKTEKFHHTQVSNILSELVRFQPIFVIFSYRDPCPNVVVEAMSFGIPVVCIGSGGVPELVAETGQTFQVNDFEHGYFSSHLFADKYPYIDFYTLEEMILRVYRNYSYYNKATENRFAQELDITVVSKRYLEVAKSVCRSSNSG